MFSDSESDSDDDIYGYNAYWDGWDGLDQSDTEDSHNYIHLDDSSDYSVGSRLSYFSDNSTDNFYDVGHSPSLFPDTVKFPTQSSRCISEILSYHSNVLLQNVAEDNVLEICEKPLFEELLESLSYLHALVSIGMNRSNDLPESCNINGSIRTIYINSTKCFETLELDLTYSANKWFVWCNDFYIDSLQKLIPFKFPYTVWKCILSYLINFNCEDKKFKTNIQSISPLEGPELIVKGIIQECIIRCCQLCKCLYIVLYSECTKVVQDKLVIKIRQLFNVFSSQMSRLACVLRVAPPDTYSIKCNANNYAIKESYNVYMEDISSYDLEDEIDLSKVICIETGFKHCSSHIVILAGANDSNHGNFYHLICIDKNTLGCKNSIVCKTVRKAFSSEYEPNLYSCRHLVGIVSFTCCDSKNISPQLIIWDLSIETVNPVCFELQKLLEICKEKDSTISTIKDIKIRGMISGIEAERVTNLENTILVLFDALFTKSQNGINETIAYSIVVQYLIKSDVTQSGKPVGVFLNTNSIGIMNNLLFLEHTMNGLKEFRVHDVSKNNKIVTSISIENDDCFKIQFNSDTKNNTCLIFCQKYLQLRQLDEAFTVLKEIRLSFHSHPQFLQHFDISFYENIAHGQISYSPINSIVGPNIPIGPNIPKNNYSSEVSTYNSLFFTIYSEHFLIDLNNIECNLVYFNAIGADDDHCNELDDEIIGDIKFSFTEFDKEGKLVQIMMSSSIDDSFAILEAPCSSMGVLKLEFYDNFNEVTSSLLPAAKEIARSYHKKKNEVEVQRKGKELIIQKNKSPSSIFITSENPIENLKRHISVGTKFTSKISAWYHNYGFCSVDIEGSKQDIYIPKIKQAKLQVGLKIEFKLYWNHKQPRPKAINIRVV